MKTQRIEMLDLVEIGQEERVKFLRNVRGGKPVCKIGTMIAFINDRDRQIIEIGSVWYVRIDAIFGNHLVITPLVEVEPAKKELKYEETRGVEVHTL